MGRRYSIVRGHGDGGASVEILSEGRRGVPRPRLCRVREENANWRTLAKLLYNRLAGLATMSLVSAFWPPSTPPAPPFSPSVHRGACHFCPLPLKRKSRGGKTWGAFIFIVEILSGPPDLGCRWTHLHCARLTRGKLLLILPSVTGWKRDRMLSGPPWPFLPPRILISRAVEPPLPAQPFIAVRRATPRSYRRI